MRPVVLIGRAERFDHRVHVSAEVVRTFTGQAEEMTGSINNRAAELARILDDKTSNFLTAYGNKGQQFSSDMDRITKDSLHAIETLPASMSRRISLDETIRPRTRTALTMCV